MNLNKQRGNRDKGNWERKLRRNKFFDPIAAFVLDDLDPNRPTYELTRFFAPLVLIVVCCMLLWLLPSASTIILLFPAIGGILLAHSMCQMLELGLGKFSWIPKTAFTLSILCGIVAFSGNPADIWGAVLGLVFILGAVCGYSVAGFKLAVLHLRKSNPS